MSIDYLDQVNELQHDERKAKAILDAFFHAYIEPEKEIALRAIDQDHQNYSYTASVILDLVCNVIQKTDDLEVMICKALEKAEKPCQ